MSLVFICLAFYLFSFLHPVGLGGCCFWLSYVGRFASISWILCCFRFPFDVIFWIRRLFVFLRLDFSIFIFFDIYVTSSVLCHKKWSVSPLVFFSGIWWDITFLINALNLSFWVTWCGVRCPVWFVLGIVPSMSDVQYWFLPVIFFGHDVNFVG